MSKENNEKKIRSLTDGESKLGIDNLSIFWSQALLVPGDNPALYGLSKSMFPFDQGKSPE